MNGGGQFVCNYCGDDLQKRDISDHIEFRCPESDSFRCEVCKQDLELGTLENHLPCTGARRRYDERLFHKRLIGSGARMGAWLKHVQDVCRQRSSLNSYRINGFLKVISQTPMVPKTKSKFLNFCRSCIGIRDREHAEELWKLIGETFVRKSLKNQHEGESRTSGNCIKAFDWKGAIMDTLFEQPSRRITLSLLESKVMQAYGSFNNLDVNDDDYDGEPAALAIQKCLKKLGNKIKVGKRDVRLIN